MVPRESEYQEREDPAQVMFPDKPDLVYLLVNRVLQNDVALSYSQHDYIHKLPKIIEITVTKGPNPTVHL